MEWGRVNEAVAFELYKQKKLATNTDVVVTKSGLWISPEYPFLGGSPDAAVFDSNEKNLMALQKLNVRISIEIIHYQRLAKILIFVVDLLWWMVESK